MSVKHVEAYYKQICEQYQEMVNDIKEFEALALEGMVAPELVDRLKEQIQPLKINYERWAYMMFLLHQPARPQKQPRYKRQNKKLLESLDKTNSIESTIKENQNVLEHMEGMNIDGRTS